jgi:hypothetical protein
MGPICCPETSIRTYQYSLRNNPAERKSRRKPENITTIFFSSFPEFVGSFLFEVCYKSSDVGGVEEIVWQEGHFDVMGNGEWYYLKMP